MRVFLYILLLVHSHCLGSLNKEGRFESVSWYPEATNTKGARYKILGKAMGESSTFFLVGMVPVTNPPSLEYAFSRALDTNSEAQTLINVLVWEETHTYFPLGMVRSIKVEGDLIRYIEDQP